MTGYIAWSEAVLGSYRRFRMSPPIRALLKAAMRRVYVRRSDFACGRADFSNVTTFADHAQFYSRHPQHWPHLVAMFDAARQADPPNLTVGETSVPRDMLAHLVQVLTQSGT